MQRRKKRNFFFSIKSKFFFCIISFVVIITTIVDAGIYKVYRKDLEEKISKSNNKILQLLSTNLDTSIEAIEQNLVFKLEACGIYSALRMPTRQTNFTMERKLRNLAAVLNAANFPVYSILLKNSENTCYYVGKTHTDDFLKMQTYVSHAGTETRAEFYAGMVQWKSFPDDSSSLYLLKQLIDPQTLQNEGILCLRINRSFFKTLYNVPECRICIYDDSGTLIYYDDEIHTAVENYALHIPVKQTGCTEWNGYLISSVVVPRKKWILAGFNAKAQILANMNYLVRNLLIFEAALCIIACFTAERISRSMTYNIAALKKNFTKIGSGEEITDIQYHSNDETACLCEKFNQMNAMLKKTIETMTYNSIQKEKAEYAALLAQMNPHFLYNTLDSIKAIAELHNQPEIASSIQSLSTLLRITVSGRSQETKLTEEVAYNQQYLNLQKLISGGRIDWNIFIDDDVENCFVPKLVLQPVVENAIIHGIGELLANAMIGIVIYRKDTVLILQVADNGIGIEQSLADRLLDEEDSDFRKDRSRMGLRNIQRRIRILYGENYGLKITSSKGNGMVVTITIPYHEQEVTDAPIISS